MSTQRKCEKMFWKCQVMTRLYPIFDVNYDTKKWTMLHWPRKFDHTVLTVNRKSSESMSKKFANKTKIHRWRYAQVKSVFIFKYTDHSRIKLSVTNLVFVFGLKLWIFQTPNFFPKNCSFVKMSAHFSQIDNRYKTKYNL